MKRNANPKARAKFESESAMSFAIAHRLAMRTPVIVHFSTSVSAGKPIISGGVSTEF